MIRGFFLLLACQLLGEVLARGLGLPAPGPGIGLAPLTPALAAWTRRRPMSDDQIAASAARGFAAGLASHGIGAACAFTVDPLAGAFAGIAMGLNAVATPIMVPLILPWLIR